MLTDFDLQLIPAIPRGVKLPRRAGKVSDSAPARTIRAISISARRYDALGEVPEGLLESSRR